MNTSDTPKTDELMEAFPGVTGHRRCFVPADFARELERENNRLKEALERIAGTTMSMVVDHSHGMTRMRKLAADALNEKPRN